jgi:hypothetical protein
METVVKKGQVRVGTRIYNKDGSFKDPSFPDFVPIIALTKSTAYGSLGPYELFDEKGRCLENVWQGSKVYASIPETLQKRSRHDPTVIWQHPAEVHAIWNAEHETWEIQKCYSVWRKKLQGAKEAIRYPVGFNHRHKCLFALGEDQDGKVIPKTLSYVVSRKEIYAPLYERLVQKKPQFKKLLDMVNSGINLLIIEVDGPHQESLDHYIATYGVATDFIERDTMLATHENLDIMLNDPKHPYGHGYCLARLLI